MKPSDTNLLRRSDYEVRSVALRECQRLVAQYHYAKGGANTGTYCHGLYRKADDALMGVAWWIPPTKSCAIASFTGDWRRVLALSRLVMVPEAPKNACTFLLSRSVDMIRRDGRFACLVTYADEWQKHRGTIYRAANWEYVGMTKPEATFIDPSTQRMVARKAGPKTRTRDEMRTLGYVCIGKFAKHKFRMLLHV